MTLEKYLADYIKHEQDNNSDLTMQEVIQNGIKAFRKISANVICQCGTIVEVITVGGQYQYVYEGTCPKCKTMWQLKDVISECDENIEIGEHGHNVEDEEND